MTNSKPSFAPGAAQKRLLAFLCALVVAAPTCSLASVSPLPATSGLTTGAAFSIEQAVTLALAPIDLADGVVLVAANISVDAIEELADIGRALERKDYRAAELRARQARGAGQFGFDVGMGVAKNQTLPGPGKDRVGDALSPAERQGFDIAVKYSLEKNANAKLAAIGAKIARLDEEVEEARMADRDVFYWLGFDIASGIYGDPALGANGNTATGPGAFKIRDALSPAGQRGFNDSVALHLARAY